jgi:signal transduction histidine kinase
MRAETVRRWATALQFCVLAILLLGCGQLLLQRPALPGAGFDSIVTPGSLLLLGLVAFGFSVRHERIARVVGATVLVASLLALGAHLSTVPDVALPRVATAVATAGLGLVLLRRYAAPGLAVAWVVAVSAIIGELVRWAGIGDPSGLIQAHVLPPVVAGALTGLVGLAFLRHPDDGPWRQLLARTDGGTTARTALLLALPIPVVAAALVLPVVRLTALPDPVVLGLVPAGVVAAQLLAAYWASGLIDARAVDRQAALDDLNRLADGLQALRTGLRTLVGVTDRQQLSLGLASLAQDLAGAESATLAVDVDGRAERWSTEGHVPSASGSVTVVRLPLRDAAGATLGTLEVVEPTREHAGALLDGLAEHAGVMLAAAASAARDAAIARTSATFMTALSHELRTPLTVVILALATLRREGVELDTDVVADLLRRAHANAVRLGELISDLLRVGPADAPLASGQQSCDLPRVVAQVALELGPRGGRPVHVDVVATAVVPLSPADAHRVVAALVDNAVRYTPADAGIWCTVRREGSGVVLEVADSGPGIPASLRQLVLRPFYRGTGVVDHAPGPGIGLTVSERLVRDAGGLLEIGERPGGGTLVRVHLPHACGVVDDQESRPLATGPRLSVAGGGGMTA